MTTQEKDGEHDSPEVQKSGHDEMNDRIRIRPSRQRHRLMSEGGQTKVVAVERQSGDDNANEPLPPRR